MTPDPSSESQEPEKSKPNFLLAAVILVPIVAALACAAWILLHKQSSEKKAGESSDAFNLQEAPQAASLQALAGQGQVRQSAPLKDPRSMVIAPSDRGGALPGLVPEAMPGGVPRSAPEAAAPRSGRDREAEFLQTYGAELDRYGAEVLEPLSRRFYRKYPVVRAVDADFAKLDSYMAVKERYFQDKDFYKFARDTIALPEVRKAIFKHALNPAVWKAALPMCLEALKTPPPKAIYAEAQRFMTGDDQMSKFLTEFSREVAPNLASMAAQAIPPGADIGPLANLAKQLSPESVRASMKSEAPSGKNAGRSSRQR